MNRRNFLAKLGIGVAAIAVAPQILSQPAPVEIGPKEVLAMQDSMMKSIVDMPISQWGGGWYDDYEEVALLQMQENMERAFFFGERSTVTEGLIPFMRRTDGLLRN